MKTKKRPTPPAIRASISFPPDLYGALEAIAEDKKVSLAWVVRDAAESYVAKSADDGNGGSQIARTKAAR